MNLESVDFVAVADANPQGLAAAGKKTGVNRLYADYHEMLAKEKPDVVAIGPRHVDQRVAMVQAAAAAGCHIYCEKPLAGDLVDADAMLAACADAGVKMAVAHQLRGMPTIRKALSDLQAGKFGRLVRMHARGKEDRRGGGEDLIVLGTHLMDLMHLFGGPPRWVCASINVGDRLATIEDKRRPGEPVGPVAGDALAASYGFAQGVHATFHSRANVSRAGRSPYGLLLQCEEATVNIRSGEVYVYPSSVIVPDSAERHWDKVWVEDWHFYPDHRPREMRDRLLRGNKILVTDLLRAIEEDRSPMSSGHDARMALEMIQGIYASHFAGGARQAIPLQDRKHPLGKL